MITEIDVAYILTKDFENLVKWYNETLSLELGYGDSHWQEFKLPNGPRFAIHNSNKDRTPSNNVIISFKVDDINNAIKELSSKGIEFILDNGNIIHDAGPSLVITFNDIDNNKIQISQTK
jgi:hypothetical protein